MFQLFDIHVQGWWVPGPPGDTNIGCLSDETDLLIVPRVGSVSADRPTHPNSVFSDLMSIVWNHIYTTETGKRYRQHWLWWDHSQQKSWKCNLKNDRMISVHFQSKPFSITVIQVYAPTSNAEEAKVEWFYEDLQDLLELTPKKDIFFIIGDWNAKVWSQEISGVTGKFGLGVQNEAGQRLREFCQENALVIANTLFQQHKRRLYTWTSPYGQHRNQIDYILCNQRWRSSVESAKTRLGADVAQIMNSSLPIQT